MLLSEIGTVVGFGVEFLHPSTVKAYGVEVVDYLLVFVCGEGAAKLVGEVWHRREVLRHEREVEVERDIGEGVEHTKAVFDLAGQHEVSDYDAAVGEAVFVGGKGGAFLTVHLV